MFPTPLLEKKSTCDVFLRLSGELGVRQPGVEIKGNSGVCRVTQWQGDAVD